MQSCSHPSTNGAFMNPAKIALQTMTRYSLYQPQGDGRSSAALKARKLLKDSIDISPSLMERISSYEQAAESLREAKRQAGALSRADASERLRSIREKLKLLKMFSQLGDKKIAREAARLAGEINRTLGLYRSMPRTAEEEEAAETAEAQDETQGDNPTAAGSADDMRSQKADAAREDEGIAREAEEALKIAREIVEEYIRRHPRDPDNKDLRRQIEEAAYTIAVMKLDSMTAAIRSLEFVSR